MREEVRLHVTKRELEAFILNGCYEDLLPSIDFELCVTDDVVFNTLLSVGMCYKALTETKDDNILLAIIEAINEVSYILNMGVKRSGWATGELGVMLLSAIESELGGCDRDYDDTTVEQITCFAIALFLYNADLGNPIDLMRMTVIGLDLTHSRIDVVLHDGVALAS